MTVLAQLILILVLTRAFGAGAERLGQPAAIGEILAGIAMAAVAALLGPSVPFATKLVTSELFHHAATVGIFFLMLLAGVELKPHEIADRSWKNFAVAMGGVVVPFTAGLGIGYLFLPPGETRFALSLLIAVTVSITSIPAAVRILTDIGLLHSAVGRTIVAAALFDDVIGLMLLAVLVAVIQSGGLPGMWEFLLLLGKIGVFFAATIVLGVHVYPRVSRGLGTLQATSIELTVLVTVALIYGLAAEFLGLHWILGTFMAALFFEPERVGTPAYDGVRLIVSGVTAGLFAPVFFASIGAGVNLDTAGEDPLFLVTVIVVAFAGKLIGAGLPAFAGGLGARDSLAVGVGMSARGAVELVVLSIAVNAGVVTSGPMEERGHSEHVYSSLVLMVVITTLLVSVVLRPVVGRYRAAPPPPENEPGP